MTDAASAAPLDPRLHACRPDLADARLEGRVEADLFVEGEPCEVASPTAPLRSAPQTGRPLIATWLMGEPVLVFEHIETREGPGDVRFVWVQSERDGYVGYALRTDIQKRGPAATHQVIIPRAHLYLGPDLKTPATDWVPLGGRFALHNEPAQNGFRRIAMRPHWAERWIYERHVAPLAQPPADWVAVAETLLGAPYLWGGDSADGVDCSGLIQTAHECAGRPCPRDSDMQEAALGDAIDPDGPLRRGDLIFWKGHVGVMRDPETLLHANAFHLAVASEPLAEARARILAAGGGPVTSARRILE